MLIPPENSASFSHLLDGLLLSSSMHLLPAKTCCALVREMGKAGRKQSFSAARLNTRGERQPRGLLCWIRLLQPVFERCVLSCLMQDVLLALCSSWHG